MDRDIVPHGEICYTSWPAQSTAGGPRDLVRRRPAAALPDELPRGSTLPGRGVLFIGDKGKMLCDGAGGMPPAAVREDRQSAKPAEHIPRSKGHHRDWLDACQGGAPAARI